MTLKPLSGLLLAVFALAASLPTWTGTLPSNANTTPAPAKTPNRPAKPQTPPSRDLEQEHFRQAAEYSQAHKGVAMVVVRGGQVVYEAYGSGVTANQGQVLASGTKSFSCALVVLGAQEGLLNLDEPVAKTITEWKRDRQKSQITIRQLLNLTSGIAGGNIGRAPSYAEALKAPVTAPVGTRFQYGPIPFQIFGEVMRRKLAAHKIAATPLEYLEQRLFQPMGLKYEQWWRTEDGQPQLPSGAMISAREWAKYGVLILNRGAWQGRQLLEPGLLNNCFQGTTINPAYGLTFWLNKNGTTPLGRPMNKIQGVSEQTVMALGIGNQTLFIIPERNLVIVRQGRVTLGTVRETEDGFQRETFLNLVFTGKKE